MTWQNQNDSIAKKESKGIGIMRRVKPFILRYSLALYNSIVQPHFDYCSAVWRDCSNSLQEKLQNRAARVVTGDNYEIRSSDVLDKLNWQPLTQRRNKQIITLEVISC